MTASQEGPLRRGWGRLIRERLAELAPSPVWRVTGAFAATALSVATAAGGLFRVVPGAQAALLGGICASLIAPARRSSVAVAGMATFVGVAIGPSSMWDPSRGLLARMIAAALAGAGAAVVAFGVKSLLARAPGVDRWLVWAVLGLVVADVWISTVTAARVDSTVYDGRNSAPLFKVLSGEVVSPESAGDLGDQYAYLQVLRALKRGEPFYRTWSGELGPDRGLGGTAGASVVNYNLPTRFLLWAALPGTPVSVVYAYLLLVSLVVAAVPFVARGSVRLPLAIPGVVAVAAYLFAYGYSIVVLTGEPWAGALVALSVAASARSSASERWRPWTVGAVVLGVLAALVREPAVLVPIAGLASALAVRDGQRPFRLAAWSVGLATFGGLYLVHYIEARPFLSGPTVGAMFALTGVESMVSALTFGTPALGGSMVLPLLLGSAGIVGILQLRDRRTLLYAATAVGASMIAYLFVNNGARDLLTGAVVNYWGTVIVPTIYACIPAVFAFVPAMAPEHGWTVAGADVREGAGER